MKNYSELSPEEKVYADITGKTFAGEKVQKPCEVWIKDLTESFKVMVQSCYKKDGNISANVGFASSQDINSIYYYCRVEWIDGTFKLTPTLPIDSKGKRVVAGLPSFCDRNLLQIKAFIESLI